MVRGQSQVINLLTVVSLKLAIICVSLIFFFFSFKYLGMSYFFTIVFVRTRLENKTIGSKLDDLYMYSFKHEALWFTLVDI